MGEMSSIATLKPKPAFAASAADFEEMAGHIDEPSTVVIMCGAGCLRVGIADFETPDRPCPDRAQKGLFGTASPKSVASETKSWTNRPICGAARIAFIRRLSPAP